MPLVWSESLGHDLGLGGINCKGLQFSLLSKIDIERLACEWPRRGHEEVEDNENTLKT